MTLFPAYELRTNTRVRNEEEEETNFRLGERRRVTSKDEPALTHFLRTRTREREKKRHVPDARSLDLCPEAIISRRSRKENLVPNQSDVVISNVPKISLGAYNFVDGIVIPLCQDFRSYQKELLLRS